ncbi:hypothetical protein EJ08DRAFT_601217, partial [Tothia fuscella]
RVQNCITLIVVSSSIIVTLLTRGTTIYLRFKILINIYKDSTYSIPKNSYLIDLLRKTQLIF